MVCKSKKVYILWIITFLFLNFPNSTYGQYLNLSDGKIISNIDGNNILPSWSSDGNRILFLSNTEVGNTICIYKFDSDTIIRVNTKNYLVNNPVWHPDGDKIVFDSKKNDKYFLYIIDLKTNKITPLFNRKVSCRNASYSASSRQVYFNGYDELNKRWEIYSYDFIYDNLNKLTSYKFGCLDPEISKNGKNIAYCKINPFKQTLNIDVINWYGEPVISFNDFEASSPTWSPTGFKLYFISKKDNKNGELYCVWKNGTHLEQLTDDDVEISNVAISPDESKIALSVLTANGWDIIMLPLSEY